MSKYRYVVRRSDNHVIVFETSDFNVLQDECAVKPYYTQVFHEKENGVDEYVTTLDALSEYEEWRSKLEKDFAWNQRFVHAVTPSHYQNYIDDYQWIDAMSRLPTMKDASNFQAALELQIRKYLDRNGKKDAPLQELKKARFYLQYLIMYIENDNQPILAKDVQKIFGDERC